MVSFSPIIILIVFCNSKPGGSFTPGSLNCVALVPKLKGLVISQRFQKLFNLCRNRINFGFGSAFLTTNFLPPTLPKLFDQVHRRWISSKLHAFESPFGGDQNPLFWPSQILSGQSVYAILTLYSLDREL